MVPILQVRKPRLAAAHLTAAPQRRSSSQSSHQLHLIPTPQLVKQNPHPGLGAGFRPAFEVEPNGVTGAASWDAFCRRGLCPSSSPSSRADSYNHHQRPRPPRVTEPGCPQGCLLNKRPLVLFPVITHHTARAGRQRSQPARRRAGRSCRRNSPRSVRLILHPLSGDFRDCLGPDLPPDCSRWWWPGRAGAAGGRTSGGSCEPGLFWEGGPQRGRHLHFKGVGPGFPTLGTCVYSGENHVALSELPTRAHPFLDRRAALNNPGS